MPEIDGNLLSQSPKKTVLTVLLQNFKKKSAVTHSVQKPMLLYFMDFSTIFSPRL